MERFRAARDTCLLGPNPLPKTEQQLQTMEQLRAQVNQILGRKAVQIVPAIPKPPADESLEKLKAIIQTSPGLTQNQVFKHAKLSRNRCCQLLNQYAGILWRVEHKGKRALCYHPLM